ncbi:hypothetical protein ACOSQ4_031582 [Xanthoceras sorbifolium]
MNMDESVIVSAIIDKITPSWKDYKRSLKHKKKDVTLEELGQHFHIEEEYIINSIDEQANSSSKVHMVEEGKEAKHHQHPKGKKRKFDLKKNQNSNKKHKGVCHPCGKPGHFKRDCHLLKKKNEENTSKFEAMISEINALEEDTTWIEAFSVLMKNMSGSLLNKHGFKLVFESDKFVLSKTVGLSSEGLVMNQEVKDSRNASNVIVV